MTSKTFDGRSIREINGHIGDIWTVQRYNRLYGYVLLPNISYILRQIKKTITPSTACLSKYSPFLLFSNYWETYEMLEPSRIVRQQPFRRLQLQDQIDWSAIH